MRQRAEMRKGDVGVGASIPNHGSYFCSKLREGEFSRTEQKGLTCEEPTLIKVLEPPVQTIFQRTQGPFPHLK
jgi:hypothetical protein